MKQGDRVPLWIKGVYGGVNLPLSFVGFPLVIYLAPFYAGELGLSLGLVGTALFVGRITDVITDLIVGVASDRWRTRFGRRRLWLVGGALVMMLGVWRLFIPQGDVDIWYLLLWVAVVYAGFTMIALPHEAWGAELSTSYQERTRITGVRQFFGLTGLVIATIIPAIVLGRGGDSGEVLKTLGWTTLILLPITVALIAVFVPEPDSRGEAHVPFWRGLKIMWRNGPFRRVMLVLLIAAVGETFRITITYFFARQVIGIENLGAVYLWYFVTGLAAVPVWIWLGNRIGKHKALALSFAIVAGVGLGQFFLGRGDELAFTILFAIKGFCFGSLQLLPSAMIADIVDVDAARSGQQRQGLFYAIGGFLLKFGMALGQGLSLNLLALVEFNPAGDSSASAILWLRVFYCLAPTLLFLIALALVWRYPLTARRHAKLRASLARRSDRLARAVPVG
jgi:Na+/melibiose symporter-like transporter